MMRKVKMSKTHWKKRRMRKEQSRIQRFMAYLGSDYALCGSFVYTEWAKVAGKL